MPRTKRAPDTRTQDARTTAKDGTDVRRTNGKGRPNKFTKGELRKAIRDYAGNRSAVAQHLGVHGSTITYALKRWPDLLEVEREAHGTRFDVALQGYDKALKEAEPWAIRHGFRWFGYTREVFDKRQVEVTGKNGGPVRTASVNLTPEQARLLTDDALERLIDGDTRVLAELGRADDDGPGGGDCGDGEAPSRPHRPTTH